MAPSTVKDARYGTWDSPISTDFITAKAVRIEGIFVDKKTSKIFLVESRPDQGGRNVIFDVVAGRDVFGSKFNARSTVHEYGGGSAIAHDNIVYFSNLPDNNVYALDLEKGDTPVSITPDNTAWRYANFCVHPIHPRILVSVLEDHTNPEPSQVVNRLATINTVDKTVTTLVEGADFYSSPKISPNGTHIAFIQWYHPDMPWEGGELIVKTLKQTAHINENILQVDDDGPFHPIAGQRFSHSAQQPTWVSNDMLLFLSDESGWLIPYIYDLSKGKISPVIANTIHEDFGDLPWYFDRNSYAVLNEKSIVCSSIREGRSILYSIVLSEGKAVELSSPYVEIEQLSMVTSDAVVFRGKKADEGDALVQYSISSNEYITLKATSETISSLPPGFISVGRGLTLGGTGTEQVVHAVFYPPTNPSCEMDPEEKPPCVASVHGGPTSRASMGLSWEKQFFTSRGWAWLDVNYGGSSGYGTKYINRLRGQWGVVDVNDTVQAVTEVSNMGLIDPKRVALRGGSAGGYTVLASVTTRSTFYATGNSLYGISDLLLLAASTHKFESRYLERLMGGTPEEIPEIYRERSPIVNADNIKVSLLILQGSEDRVVPPEQAKTIVQIIQRNGGKVKYVEFEGEGHGWRIAKNIKASLESELMWYKEIFAL